MLYRYLKTHAYETLRDKMFMVSPPTKFNDIKDCSADVVGEPTCESVADRYGKDSGFIATASQAGFSVDQILAVLNSKCAKEATPSQYAKIAREVLSGRSPLERTIRVLCLCDAEGYENTDCRMWRRYATFQGVRIGLDIAKDDELGKFARYYVAYKEAMPKFDLSNIKDFEAAFDIRRLLTTKEMQWAPEREVRVIAEVKDCVHIGELDFLRFNPGTIRRVDIGREMPRKNVKGLVRMIRKNYPDVKIYQAEYDLWAKNVKYSEMKSL